MIWFYFLTGLLIGVLMTAIAALISMFQTHLKHEEALCKEYAEGYETGREWKSSEISKAEADIMYIKGVLDGMNNEN